MNITFAGSENHAAAFSLEMNDDKKLYLSNTLTCKPDNINSKTLDEYEAIKKRLNIRENQNTIVIKTKNKLSQLQTDELIHNNQYFLDKYNPRGDILLINGAYIKKEKGNFDIFKFVENLLDNIEKRPTRTLKFQPNPLETRKIALSLFEENQIDTATLNDCLDVSNIKLNAKTIRRAAKNASRNLI